MWKNTDTCFYKLSETKDIPFVGFDFDDTLVKLKTSFILSNVKPTLIQLSTKYNIVIFSNQNGVKRQKCTHEFVRENFDNFLKQVDLPISIFYSIDTDKYRKPNIGMFNLFKQLFNKPLEWYCGDACGRKKDFSNSDLYFANNCGIRFKIPEHIFNKQPNDINIVKCSKLYTNDKWESGININKQQLVQVTDTNITLPCYKKILIVMVGPQGSGKSLVTNMLIKKHNFNVVSLDNISSKSKLKKIFNQYKQSENVNGIIVDNTNATLKNRQEWFSLVDETWTKLIIYINIPKLVSLHLVKYREFYTNKHIPNVAVHSFYKRLEPPNKNEANIIELVNPILYKPFNHNLRFT